MRRILWLAVPLLALHGQTALADDKKTDEKKDEWQLSIWGGEQHMRVDRDLHFRGDATRLDMWNNGISIARRQAAGLVLVLSAETSYHDSDLGKDNDFYIDHYSGAVGWQFDAERWRITPKVGITRSRLGNQARLLLNENGGRVFERNYTVPFVEASVQRRLGRHWAIGANVRETFEEFGYSRSWGIDMSILW